MVFKGVLYLFSYGLMVGGALQEGGKEMVNSLDARILNSPLFPFLTQQNTWTGHHSYTLRF